MPEQRTLAIVGDGPRALFALESLLATVGPGGVLPRRIDVLSPSGLVGPGQVYAAGQPPWARLNVASSAVDVAGREATGGDRRCGDIASPSPFPSLDAWREHRDPGSTQDQFPSRSLVGDYLADMGTRVRAALGPGRVRVVPGTVTRVRPVAGGWRLRVQDATGEQVDLDHDEVLLATGHAGDWPGALHHADAQGRPGAVALHPGVFPLQGLIDRARRDAPELVLVRGAALTGIDAALALSEGLGGRFLPRDGSPWLLRYQPARHQPRIVLTGRTGRLMLPKTTPAVLASIPDLAQVLARHGRRLADPAADVAQVLTGCAVEVLQVSRNRWPAEPHDALPAPDGTRALLEVEATLGHLVAGGPGTEPRRWLTRSLEQAHGVRAPDASWALGQAWRGIYPALVARQEALLEEDDRPPAGWPAYRVWSAELERLAFGPPAVNAAKLLALLEGGVLQVEAVPDLATAAPRLGADLVVDAVLAPPGVRDITCPVWGALVSEGVVGTSAARRGVPVTPDLTCLDPDGSPVRGLAAVGRATEDVVLGNDTLVRSLHPHLDRWARRVTGLETP